MRKKVFLTDTHWRTSYYICKSLAKKGVKVIGLKTVDSIFDKSSYYSEMITITPIETNPQKYISKIEQISASGDILIPISPEAIKLVAHHYALLSKKLLVPPIQLNQLEMALDKQKSINFMQKIGIPIPKSFYPKSLNDAEEALSEISFPIVLKLSQEGNIPPQNRYGIAHNIDDFKTIFRKLSVFQIPIIVQEYIHGNGVGVSIIANNGTILAMYPHQRLREQFKTGGPSTYCSYFASNLIENYATTFAQKSKWNGIVMLEFKYNSIEKTLCFMEMNPRFWGSMELAIEAGVNFPYLFLEWMLGNSIKKNLVPSKKLKLKYLSMDIEAFTESIIDLDLKIKLKQIFAYLKEYLDLDLRFAYIDIKDWKISAYEIFLSIKRFGRMVKNAL